MIITYLHERRWMIGINLSDVALIGNLNLYLKIKDPKFRFQNIEKAQNMITLLKTRLYMQWV